MKVEITLTLRVQRYDVFSKYCIKVMKKSVNEIIIADK